MISKIKTFVAVAALSGSLGANVYAAMQSGDTQSNQSNVHTIAVGNLHTDRIQHIDAPMTANHTTVNLSNKAAGPQVSVLPNKPASLITDLIQTGVNNKNIDAGNQKLTVLAVATPIRTISNSGVVVPASGQASNSVAAMPASLSPAAFVTPDAALATPVTPDAAPAGQAATPALADTGSASSVTQAAPAPASTTASTSTAATTGDAQASAAAPANTDASTTASTGTDSSSASQAGTQTSAAADTPTQAAPAPAPKATQDSAPAADATSNSNSSTSTKVITVKATAYTASCTGCSGVTATGIDIKDNPNEKVIAVDPKVIPLGSKVYVEGVGYATAADTGGAIKGNRIDVFIPSEEEALKFGVKHLSVKILN